MRSTVDRTPFRRGRDARVRGCGRTPSGAAHLADERGLAAESRVATITAADLRCSDASQAATSETNRAIFSFTTLPTK
jgi:hypothetical protein